MEVSRIQLGSIFILFLCCVSAKAGTHYVNLSNPTPSAPYTSWETAANDIQSAVDVATSHDTVLVSDGTYQLPADLSIQKPIVLESVNGARSTILKAAASKRCLTLGNFDSHIKGFTVTGGSEYDSMNGGGIYCSGVAPVIDSCIIEDNYAPLRGGGVYGGTVRNSLIRNNRLHPYASSGGGGLFSSVVENCTIVGNYARICGGASNCTLLNSISFNNKDDIGFPNVDGGEASYSCSPDLISGIQGNISDNPLLDSNGYLTPSSPCISAGKPSAVLDRSDMDGNYWGTPPSMGFHEISNPPLFYLETPETIFTRIENTFEFWGLSDSVVSFQDGSSLSNQTTFTKIWDVEGTYSLIVSGHNPASSGELTFTQTLHVISFENSMIHVSPTGNDLNDGSDWSHAKATIQSAVEAQDLAHGGISVSNGVYELESAIIVNKPVRIIGLNGSEGTIVDGGKSIQCFYLQDPGCVLDGLTIRNGQGSYGGGVRCESQEQLIMNCALMGNTADYGGGLYKGTMYNSFVMHNRAHSSGGGVYLSTVIGSAIAFNSAWRTGGAYQSELIHCNVVKNTADEYWSSGGAGIFDCTARNSIIYYNHYAGTYSDSGTYSTVSDSCIPDQEHGVNGNITNAPVLVDIGHIDESSPCAGKGNSVYSEGLDIDGETWPMPSSMGSDSPDDNAHQIPRMEWTLSLTASPNGSIWKTSGESPYLDGDYITLEAIPDAGYIFTGWSDDASGFNNPLNLLMDGNKTVTANYRTKFDGTPVDAGDLDWAASSANNGIGGTVTWNTQDSDYIAGGSALQTPSMSAFENIDIEAYVEGPAVVKFHWKVGGTRPGRMVCSVDDVSKTRVSYGLGWTEDLVTVPAGRHRISWQTETLTSIASMGSAYLDNVRVIPGDLVSLSVSADSRGQIVTLPATNIFTRGESVTIEAVPQPGYEFIEWTGDLSGLPNPVTLTMDQERRVVATFYRALDGRAVGLPDTTWWTGGVGEWKVNDVDGGFVNGAVNGRGGTWIETRFVGPCELSFDWKFEPNREGADGLYVYADDVRTQAPNSFGWTRHSIAFPAGAHVLRVSFANFVDVNALNNRNVFIRNIVFKGSDWLAATQALGDGVYWSPYFGEFQMDGAYPLILSSDFGWQYLHPDNDSLVYDFRLEKWLLINRSLLPLVRGAEAPAHWFLHDGRANGPETIENPPTALPDPARVDIGNTPFPSNAFITATSSGDRVFSLWRDPVKAYEIQSSMNLTNWVSYSGPERFQGYVQLFEPDDIVTTNGAAFIRAEINETP